VRLIRPSIPAASDHPASDRMRLDRIEYRGRPQWLRDWIAEQGVYVELACGHRENVNDRSTISLMIKVFGKKQLQVLCEECDDFRHVARSLKRREFLGIKRNDSDVPLF